MLLLNLALSGSLFLPDVIIPGVPTAGDNFNIICRLDGVVERLVNTPQVVLAFVSPLGGASGEQSQDGLAFIRPRIFNPMEISDVGNYTCAASIISLGFIATSSPNVLQIRSK